MAIGSTSLFLAPIGAVDAVSSSSTRWPARSGRGRKRSSGSNPSLPSLLSVARFAVASCGACLLLASAPSADAGLLRTDFSAPLPAGVTASGSTEIDGGVLKLTNAGTAQGGDFRVEDLDGGSAVKRMTVSFRMLIGGGTSGPGTSVLSGDGLSFSFASDLPASPGSLGEEGAGSGLRVSFDTFDGDGAGTADAIAIDVFFNGALKGRREFQSSQGTAGSDFYDVVIDLYGNGKLDLLFGQYQPNVDAPVPVFSGLETEYTPSGGWTFALAARTGNLHDNHWIDDLTISTKVPEPGTLALLVLAFGCAAVARSRR